MVVGQQNLFGVDQLGLAVQQGVLEEEAQKKMRAGVPGTPGTLYLDVFSPCYENQDEAGGEEDEEECSNNFQAAQLVTTYLLYGSITYITCMVVSHISHIYHIYHMYITCMGVTTCHISYIGVSFHSIWSKCPFFRISVKAREQKVLTERERLTGLRD